MGIGPGVPDEGDGVAGLDRNLEVAGLGALVAGDVGSAIGGWGNEACRL